MQQSPINNVQPEQELNNEQMPIDTTSSPTIAKPIVGCSASLSEKVEQILTIVNGLSLNDAEYVIRESSKKVTQFAIQKKEAISFTT